MKYMGGVMGKALGFQYKGSRVQIMVKMGF